MNSTVKLNALTSLRFFAAAMIVLGHSHRLFGSFGLATTFSLAQGVSFFFILSGFILAYNYPVLSGRKEIFLFFKARFARIWPAHIAAIGFMFVLIGDFNIGGLTYVQSLFSAFANIFLIQSIFPLRDVFLTFNGVAWSISTEAFFYIAFPFLISSIIPGWKVKLCLLGCLVFLIGWFAVAWNIPADESAPQVNFMGLLYVNPVVRVFEFFVGILACKVFLQLRAFSFSALSPKAFTFIELLVIALALMSMWLSPRLTNFLGWYGPVAGVVNYYLVKAGSFLPFAGLIIIFALNKGAISRALSWAPMVLLGEISFALYLTHMSILKWYENNLSLFSGLPKEINTIGYWLVAILVAFLLHKSIENPFRKFIMSFQIGQVAEAFKSFLSARYLVYTFAVIFLLLGFAQLPATFADSKCAPKECDAIVSTSSLPVAADFGDYVSLLAVRSTSTSQGGRRLDFVFEVIRPLPKGYHLAVHLVDDKSQIINQIDFIIKSESLTLGDRFIERADFSADALASNVVDLGLAIYHDPRSPLPVAFTRTDYEGRRLLMDFYSIESAY